ncbi:hypothetical protein AYI68_g7187 [Smittium mucronatum]|uniref:Uncharacterized protein n=1 Tax=Smittium mucronatum TaxID=133383 RepID=A0A1R0GPG2_9FUNG|nr:hypothetical protein AYI68_g7187 [Smittium mucronatum]
MGVPNTIRNDSICVELPSNDHYYSSYDSKTHFQNKTAPKNKNSNMRDPRDEYWMIGKTFAIQISIKDRLPDPI